MSRTSPTVDTMTAWAEATSLVRYGGLPAVLMGFGAPGKAHRQDGSDRIDDVSACAEVIAVYPYGRLVPTRYTSAGDGYPTGLSPGGTWCESRTTIIP
ncbi:MAG TPA: hypothetical protein ENN80_08355 [Candidatus Hydrogenedentes bacterium]|nr:hypothetical protein [Candidatus Hydrogenedentota bacterium]